MTRITLNVERLKELLVYDYATGVFTWAKSRAGVRAGDVAGRLHPEGYRTIKIDGRNYLEHRVVWLYVHGQWPVNFIDHKNRVRHDNRIENLRDVSRAENGQNTLLSPRNRSGYRGVSWNKNECKWNAKIGHQGKKVHLGYFNELQDAVSAYKRAATRLHKFNPVGAAN